MPQLVHKARTALQETLLCSQAFMFHLHASIPLELAQMGMGGESLEGDRAKPCYWHITTHFSWPWCIPG